MNNLNLNLFKYFYYVAFYKGFTNASKQLNVAQSALSYSVKQLELQLDKNLILRNSKNFELTDDGNNLYENLKNVFYVLESSISSNSSSSFQELVIGIRHSLSDYVFRDAITKFINNNPNIHLTIKQYSKLDIQKFKDQYDLVIDYDYYIDMIDSQNKTNLVELNNVIVAGKELYKEFEEVDSIKDLSNANLISLNPNKKNGKFQQMCFENGILFKDIISINDSILCKKLILDNIGLCFIDENCVSNELFEGSMIKLNIKEELFKDKLLIAYKNNSNSEIINKFIDILKKEYEVK